MSERLIMPIWPGMPGISNGMPSAVLDLDLDFLVVELPARSAGGRKRVASLAVLAGERIEHALHRRDMRGLPGRPCAGARAPAAPTSSTRSRMICSTSRPT
jgi:hypothetical protein